MNVLEKILEEKEIAAIKELMLNVQTSYGAVKCGFYRVRDDRWYIYEEFYNEFIEANKKEVVAWQPFPEPYKEG